MVHHGRGEEHFKAHGGLAVPGSSETEGRVHTIELNNSHSAQEIEAYTSHCGYMVNYDRDGNKVFWKH